MCLFTNINTKHESWKSTRISRRADSNIRLVIIWEQTILLIHYQLHQQYFIESCDMKTQSVLQVQSYNQYKILPLIFVL